MAREAAAAPVTYLPHRREPAEALERVARIPGVRVQRLDMPVELALAGIGRPLEIRSLLSSTLTTLPIVLAGTGSTVTETTIAGAGRTRGRHVETSS